MEGHKLWLLRFTFSPSPSECLNTKQLVWLKYSSHIKTSDSPWSRSIDNVYTFHKEKCLVDHWNFTMFFFQLFHSSEIQQTFQAFCPIDFFHWLVGLVWFSFNSMFLSWVDPQSSICITLGISTELCWYLPVVKMACFSEFDQLQVDHKQM